MKVGIGATIGIRVKQCNSVPDPMIWFAYLLSHAPTLSLVYWLAISTGLVKNRGVRATLLAPLSCEFAVS
ncbi:hypothetical protein GCM10010525_27200 [Glutamicibacter bergerei]|uniref:Uncharacterized protein n=1 Tax=Glutamicibacter ardleyensis TaxID=225894 RepID=A0ABQ2DQA6_9MICC|nr:hypothetical protein GCM10007173_26100 [Glutamicibacter ardleyensis]